MEVDIGGGIVRSTAEKEWRTGGRWDMMRNDGSRLDKSTVSNWFLRFGKTSGISR